MRITIAPTSDQSKHTLINQDRTVVITHSSDDLDIEVVGELVRSALLAWGFSPETIKELFCD